MQKRDIVNTTRGIVLSITVIYLFIPLSINHYEFPAYRVALDPGHGGISMLPVSRHGDRYDTVSGSFLERYRDGAYSRNIGEHQIVFSIAQNVYRLLKYCSPGGSYGEFYTILQKYTDKPVKRIIIECMISRPVSLQWKKRNKADPNMPYRLYDSPSGQGEMEKGRISKINDFAPHLLVSLHCARSGPRDHQGMSPVLVAPFELLHEGLLYLKGQKSDIDFYNTDYGKNWFTESVTRTPFRWFLNDVSLYFLSRPLDNENKVKTNRFRGYRHNMVHWDYRDHDKWETAAGYAIPGSPYGACPQSFELHGKFWEREQSCYESYRRDNGPEGYGGDNAYACNEIIRYILFSLNRDMKNLRYTKPGKPYISVWTLPLLVNAITAFIELGYLNRGYDKMLMTQKQDEIAEGIAVGIYSLFAGIDVVEDGRVQPPGGKRIDLEKYIISNKETYFDIVSE